MPPADWGSHVSHVLRRLAAGDASLDPADVRACLTYAADVLGAAPATLPPADPAATLPPTPTTAAAAPLSVPGYELHGELGRGGMGVVYQARQTSLNRTVALKMVLAGGHAGAKERARFRAEAEAVARLQHPNIVQIYEVGEHDGLPYFSLEYVPGGTLAARLDGQPWPADQAAALVETLARAVHAAHAAGIVHRDLKPGNVLLGTDGSAKITDFGLAKRLESDGPTRTGEIMGTPEYMAPEQAAGRKDVGPAADVWSLGAILYELLTGRPPFRGATALDTIIQVTEQDAIPARRLNRAAGRDLEAVCWKCLVKDPAQRYPSAADLAADLRRALDGAPVVAKPPGAFRRLNHWIKRLPETTSLGGVVGLILIGLLVFSSNITAAAGAAGLWILTATVRARLRAAAVGAAAGAVGLIIAAVISLATPIVLPWRFLWLAPPVAGVVAGALWRDRWPIRLAYVAGAVVVFAFAERHEEANDLLVISVVAGFYIGGLARVMAWWTGGSIAGAVFGALGGGFVGMLLGTAATIPVMTRMGDQEWSDWIGLLLLVSFTGFEVLGTIGGAFYGARRRRRRAT